MNCVCNLCTLVCWESTGHNQRMVIIVHAMKSQTVVMATVGYVYMYNSFDSPFFVCMCTVFESAGMCVSRECVGVIRRIYM